MRINRMLIKILPGQHSIQKNFKIQSSTWKMKKQNKIYPPHMCKFLYPI